MDKATHGIYVSYKNPEHGEHLVSKGTSAEMNREIWELDNVPGKYEELVAQCPLGAPHNVRIKKLKDKDR
jgi:hypothetical protein